MIYKDGGYRIRIVKDTGMLGTSGNPLKELKAGDWLTYYTHTGGECGVWFAPDVARVAARALGLDDSEYEVVEVGFFDTRRAATLVYNLFGSGILDVVSLKGSLAFGSYSVTKDDKTAKQN
jgi:hypothetical protein